MNILYYLLLSLFILVQVVFAAYILIPFLFLALYFLLRLFRARTPFERRPFKDDKQYDFALIITAHQETRFVFPLMDSILKQRYGNFHAYIVADDCNIEGLVFNDPRVTVIKPEPALHGKTKSIHYALDRFIRKHDAIIIFDADNLIHPSYLEIINRHFQKGYRVVQSNFKPKNIDSNYARMDAIGDMFNFFLEREMRMRLNISAAIWGSGVAISEDLYRGIEYRDALGGFDKKLQSHLTQHADKISFAEDALLYDEKITSGKSLENQRTRWISSYFKYFHESWFLFSRGLIRGNMDMLYTGFIMLRPPLFIILGMGILFTIAGYFIHPIMFYSWLFIMLSFFLSFAGIVVLKGRDSRFLVTILSLPLFVFNQAMALLKVRKAKKSFMKTQHSREVYIDELLKG